MRQAWLKWTVNVSAVFVPWNPDVDHSVVPGMFILIHAVIINLRRNIGQTVIHQAARSVPVLLIKLAPINAFKRTCPAMHHDAQVAAHPLAKITLVSTMVDRTVVKLQPLSATGIRSLLATIPVK